MKQGLILLLAVCTLSAAMVPRERRAVNTEEEEEEEQQEQQQPKKEETTTPEKKECAPQTPCKWVIYDKNHYNDLAITNTYCVCSAGTECIMTEDDTGVQSLVYRCRVVEDHTEDASEVEDSS